MKEYFVACYFLDQGMEGIPNLTTAFIIEAKKTNRMLSRNIRKKLKRI